MAKHAKGLTQARADPLAARLFFLTTTAEYEREHDSVAFKQTAAEIRRIG